LILLNEFVNTLSNGDGTKTPKWDQEVITAFTNIQIQLLEYDQFKKNSSRTVKTI
jgi:hypothetical protein